MFESVISEQDVSDALTYVLSSQKDSLPIRSAYESQIIKARSAEFVKEWLQEIYKRRIVTGNVPVVDAPKGEGLVRPIHAFRIREEVIYTLAGLLQLDSIAKAVGPKHRYQDYSYIFRSPITRTNWFYSYYRGWNDFKRATVTKIERGIPYVVQTDISGFYENIDHRLLFARLHSAGISQPIQDFLRGCLDRFMSARRGLPQSQATSHLLAKFYMSLIDEQLVGGGHDHVRYSDDIRIFVSSIRNGKVALLALTRRLREVTLSIQGAKTFIMDAETAKADALGASPLIEVIRREYDLTITRELEDLIEGSEYLSMAELIEERIERDGRCQDLWYR